VRKILTLLGVTVLIGLSACSLVRGDGFDTKEKPEITVFMKLDSTQDQRDAVEAAIRATAGVDTVRYESPEAAYADYKSHTEGTPAFDPSITADLLPPSFRLTTKDLAAYNKLRNGSFADDMKSMPGVADVVYQCALIAECKAKLSPSPVG
jgi:cell division protein FtsX